MSHSYTDILHTAYMIPLDTPLLARSYAAFASTGRVGGAERLVAASANALRACETAKEEARAARLRQFREGPYPSKAAAADEGRQHMTAAGTAGSPSPPGRGVCSRL